MKKYTYLLIAAMALLSACRHQAAAGSEQTEDSTALVKAVACPADGCFVEISDYDIETDEMLTIRGHIKSLTANYYRLSSADDKGGVLYYTEQYTFDPAGRTLSRSNGQSDTEYAYNAEGLLESLKYFDKGIKTPNLVCDYTYDAAGHLTEETTRYSYQKNPQKTTYSYDAAGNMLCRTYYETDGRMQNRYEYTYDADGKQLSETTYFPSGEVMYVISYTYNAEGLLTRVSNSKINDYTTYEYSADGKLLCRKEYWDGELTSGTDYTYNAAGQLLQQTCKIGGETVSRITCTYDEQGTLQSRLYYFSDEEGSDHLTRMEICCEKW